MAQHGISKPTVIKALKILESYGIIAVNRKKDPKTRRQMVNIYALLDKAKWKKLSAKGEPGTAGKSEEEGDSRVPGENPEPSKGYLPGPSKQDLPGAGSNLEHEPGKIYDKKPGKRDLPEGSTEEKEAHRKVNGADAPDSPQHKCKSEGCNKSPIKDRDFCKEHQSMTCVEFVEWYRKSNHRYINLIAEFADEVKPDFETVAQWEIWASQHYKAAQKLAPFSDEKIAKAYADTRAAGYITEFNLWTVSKFLLNTSKK